MNNNVKLQIINKVLFNLYPIHINKWKIIQLFGNQFYKINSPSSETFK